MNWRNYLLENSNRFLMRGVSQESIDNFLRIINLKNSLQQRIIQQRKAPLSDPLDQKKILRDLESEFRTLESDFKRINDNWPNICGDIYLQYPEGRIIQNMEIPTIEGLTYSELISTEVIQGHDFGEGIVIFQGNLARSQILLEQLLDRWNSKEAICITSCPEIISTELVIQTGLGPLRPAMYSLDSQDRWLVPTAEPILVKIALELKHRRVYTTTSCFRKEASSDKTSRGPLRVHHFRKTELVSIVPSEEASLELEYLREKVSKCLQLLGLTYRTLLLPPWDIANQAMEAYDLEVWYPVSKRWIEVSSISNCGVYQVRRLKLKNLSSLNASCLAYNRILMALVEYHQNTDLVFYLNSLLDLN